MGSFSSLRLFAAKRDTTAKQGEDDEEDDWKVPQTVNIPEQALDVTFVRSSGPGGQNVNKVSTAVQVKVFVDGMGWIPYEVRERLKQRERNSINKEGFLVYQVSDYRTQIQNRKSAVQKLREMILGAWPRPKKRIMRTGPTEKMKQKNVEWKRRRSELKQRRRNKFDDW